MDITLCFDDKLVAWVSGDDRTLDYGRAHTGELLTATLCTGKNERDAVRHNQFFAVVTRAVNSMTQYDIQSKKDERQAVENCVLSLKYAVGFTDIAKTLDGQERIVPRSIDFDVCSEQEAETFRELAYGVLCQLLQVSRRELFSI